MDLKEQIEDILKITNWSSSTSSGEVIKLRSAYFNAFKEYFPIKCGNCIQKAYWKLRDLYEDETQLKQKTMGLFELKKGKIIQVHGLPDQYTHANMTDDKAVQILKKYPSHIKTFEVFPENWKEIVNGKPAETKTEDDFESESKEIIQPKTEQKKGKGKNKK